MKLKHYVVILLSNRYIHMFIEHVYYTCTCALHVHCTCMYAVRYSIQSMYMYIVH